MGEKSGINGIYFVCVHCHFIYIRLKRTESSICQVPYLSLVNRCNKRERMNKKSRRQEENKGERERKKIKRME